MPGVALGISYLQFMKRLLYFLFLHHVAYTFLQRYIYLPMKKTTFQSFVLILKHKSDVTMETDEDPRHFPYFQLSIYCLILTSRLQLANDSFCCQNPHQFRTVNIDLRVRRVDWVSRHLSVARQQPRAPARLLGDRTPSRRDP